MKSLLLLTAVGSGGFLYLNKDSLLNSKFFKKSEKVASIDYQKVR